MKLKNVGKAVGLAALLLGGASEALAKSGGWSGRTDQGTYCDELDAKQYSVFCRDVAPPVCYYYTRGHKGSSKPCANRPEPTSCNSWGGCAKPEPWRNRSYGGGYEKGIHEYK